MVGPKISEGAEIVDLNKDVVDTTDPKNEKIAGPSVSKSYKEPREQTFTPSGNRFASRHQEDISVDPTKFDFQLKTDADNEEIRARRQSGWQLARNSGAQILAMGVGGMVSGFGYMADLFTNLPNLVTGDEVEFNNILTQIGTGIQDTVQDFAPIHQTRRAQEGGWRAMGDATWWAGNAPTLASSLAIMIPTYAVSRGIGTIAGAVGRNLGKTSAGTKTAERLSPTLKKLYGSRRARGTVDHLGTSVLSRHVYNSLESDDVYKQEYEESLQKGLSEEEAKKRAGQAAATMYRLGYANIWKDILQWRMILGRPFGQQAGSRNWYTNATKNANNKRVVDDLTKRFGNKIPREAIRQVGISGQKGIKALKTTAKMGLLEGFEEINIQHQKMLARDYINDLTGNIGEPGTGWGDIYGNLMPGYLESLGDFVYDEDSFISPEAFDAAFWAFGSGVAMGGAMKAVQPKIDRALGSGEATRHAKDLATFNYFKNQMGALQVAQVENNAPLEQQIYDEGFFSLVAGSIQDGNTHVDGALRNERLGDLIASLEEIVKADETTLENSGIPTTTEMRKTYERMLSDTYYIAERFDKHFNETANLSTDDGRALSTTLTYYEYMKKRLTERLSDFESQKNELENQIDTDVLQDEYKSILPLRLKQKGHKRSIEQLNEYITQAKKAEPENTTDETHKQNQIELFEARKEILQERIKDYQQQINDSLEGIETNEKQQKVLNTLVNNQMELIDVNEFIADHEAHKETLNNELQELYTEEGQNKYINERKKNISNNRNKHKQAEIKLATTKKQLEDLGEEIDTYANETKQLYKDQLDIITERDRAATKVEAPKIDQEYIDRVDERVPTMDSVEYSQFKKEIEGQDIHGNTKNKILEYADSVYQASRQAVANVENKIEIRKLKENLKQNYKQLIDRVFSESNLNSAMNVINKADVSGEVKRDITEVAKEYYNRLDNKIPPTQKEEINTDKKAKDKREGKEVETQEEVETTFTQEDDVFPFGEIQDLAVKISKGEKATTPRELQLQANYSDALETELNQLQETEVKETTESITLPLAKDQYGQNSEGKWRLEFKLEDGELSITNRAKDYERRNKLVDFEQMANPAIKQGDTVTLQLLEGDEIGIVHKAHDRPIGAIRKPTPDNYSEHKQIAIQRELNERQKIVNALKEGKKVTATITTKIVDDSNINNIKVEGETFVRDIGTIETAQYTKKEDGRIVQEDRPVILVTSEGIPQNADAKLSLNTDFYPFLDQAIKEEINTQIADVALKTEDQYFGGHVWTIQLDPFGTWKALKTVTRRLDNNAVSKASTLLLEGNISDADHIVNISSNLHKDTKTSLYLNAHVLNESENTFRIDYFDPNLGEVVRLEHNVKESGFKAYRLNKDEPRVKKDKKGFESFQFQTEPSDINYKEGLKKLLATKRYNVLRDGLGSTDTPYTSPLTGKEHASYYDYLTKDNVWKGEEEFQGDGNNILATDLYSENGSFWSNVGMRVSTEVNKPSTQQKKSKPEYTQPEKIDDTAVEDFDFIDDISDTSEFETERDKAISEAYNKYKDTFKEGNKFVTLEDFSQEVFFNQLTSPEKIMKFAESVAEKIKNNC